MSLRRQVHVSEVRGLQTMKIRILRLDQLNKHSPYAVGRDFQNVVLHKKGRPSETETYDYWGAILGRWYILVRRKPVKR